MYSILFLCCLFDICLVLRGWVFHTVFIHFPCRVLVVSLFYPSSNPPLPLSCLPSSPLDQQCYAACMYAFSFPAADRRQIPNLRHLNPAVTFGLVISFKIHIGRAILYWMAQFCGAGVGVLSIYLFTPFEKKDVTTAYPLSEEANFAHSWVMETLVSWFSILAILMTCFGHLQKQPSAAHSIREASPLTNHEVNCLIAASIIIGGNLAASSTSGGFMNPLFSTGIGILSGTYELAPFFAPFIGAVGALITGLIFGFKVKVMYFKDN